MQTLKRAADGTAAAGAPSAEDAEEEELMLTSPGMVLAPCCPDKASPLSPQPALTLCMLRAPLKINQFVKSRKGLLAP